MTHYILRRLLLVPFTLFFVILVNFTIINLAPGDPTTIAEITPEGGASRQEDKSVAFGTDDRYLQFREHYGLTLPVLFNTWPWLSKAYVEETLQKLTYPEKMDVKGYDELRLKFGDQSRFIMPKLLSIMDDPSQSGEVKRMASRFFARGGTRQAVLGSKLTPEQRAYNRKIARDNDALRKMVITPFDQPRETSEKIARMNQWYAENHAMYRFEPTPKEKLYGLFFETRFFRYLSRVATLDFGAMRNDQTKSVISEVTKRFKYSLTLSITPMLISLVLCQIFGFTMALWQNRWPDFSLNFTFLILYAIPVFVVAPFLIEKVALNHDFPFSNTPIPISGFTSSDAVYAQQVSYQRLFDVARHIFLPLVAIMYGTLAASSRLSRTAVLEVLRQDYVRTARSKGLAPFTVMWKHVGRNAAITIVTSIAASLGIVLGGSLIVETIFEIDGFGKFFYDAVINRDYNVIMFSALAGSFLTLIGYLIADISYTLLDPRISLE